MRSSLNAAGRHGGLSLGSLVVLAVMVTALPAGAQSLQDLMKKNEALVNQNKTLMEQNRQLMEMVHKNAARIQKIESTVSTVSTGTTSTAAPAAARGPLEQRVITLETKQAALDKRSGGVMKSGSKKVRLNFSGQVSRMVTIANDGDNTDVYNVDNDNSGTRFRFIGEADVLGQTTAGTNIELQFQSNSSEDVNQINESNSPELKERKLEFYVGHPKYGKLSVGQGDTASNVTAEVDLSGADIIAYSSVTDSFGGLLFHDDRTGALSAAKINAVGNNFDGLSRDDRVRYDTPNFYGFNLSGSTISSDKYDVALRHSGQYGNFKVAGAFAYSEPKSDTDNRIDGSLSVLHSSGVNLTVAGGRDDLRSGPRDPWAGYVKLGYIFDWNKHKVPMMARIGNTAVVLDYQRTEDKVLNDDAFQTIGLFAVQNVDQWAAQLYMGVRWHDLNREGTDMDPIIASAVGGRFKF